MELIYLWIKGYKNLEETSIILNPAYKEVSPKENGNRIFKNIRLEERKNYINIFGNNLNVITIVGRNGSGKSNITNALSSILRAISSCHNVIHLDDYDKYDDNSLPQKCSFCLIIKYNKEYIAYCSDNCINDLKITIKNKKDTVLEAKYNDQPNCQLIFKKKRLEQSGNKKINVAKFQPFYKKDDANPVNFTLWNGVYDITKIKLDNYFYYDRFRLYDTVRNLIELRTFDKNNELIVFEGDNEKLKFNKYSPYLDIYEALDWAYDRIKDKSSKDASYPIISALGRAISRIKNRIKNNSFLNKSIDSLFKEVLPKLFFTYALGEIFDLIENYEIDDKLTYKLKNIIGMRSKNEFDNTISDREPDCKTRKTIYKNLNKILFNKGPVKYGLIGEVITKLPENYNSERLEDMLSAYLNYEEKPDKKKDLQENYTLLNGKIIQLKEPVNFENKNKPYITNIEALKGISKNLYMENGETLYDFMSLSTGEQRLMRFFADVYYCADKLKGNNETNIFLFDEMDLSWHPEWQRKMIYYVYDLFKKIAMSDENKNRKFNLIFTTHSPFILSDMPQGNVIFLDKGNNITKTVNLNTFGANIHDLFNCGFFFEYEGCCTMGKFVQNLIQKDILSGIENLNENNQKDLEYKINLIGDPLLKNALLEKLYFKDEYKPESESIEYLKVKNKKLQQRIDELEKEKNNEKN